MGNVFSARCYDNLSDSSREHIAGFEKMLHIGIRVIFGILSIATIALLFCYEGIDFFYRRPFLIPMPLLLLAAIALWILAFKGKRLFSSSSSRATAYKVSDCIAALIVVAMLAVHLVSAGQLLFIGSWDTGGLYTAAWNMSHGWAGIPDAPQGWNEYFTQEQLQGYFSTYPNNCFLVSLMALCMTFLQSIGIYSFAAPMILFTGINSLLVAISGLLVYLFVRRQTNPIYGLVSLLLFSVLVGASLWFLVPYSDSFAIFVPIAIVWLLSLLPEKVNLRFCGIWFFVFLLGVFSYFIKPQMVFIVLGAALLILLPKLLSLFKARKLRDAFGAIFAVVFAMMVACCFKTAIVSSAMSGLALDESASFSPYHYLMMGLNDETNGGFCADDVYYSESFDTASERDAADLDRAFERISEKGAVGLILHEAKKQLTIWGDASFGWDQEGGIAGTYAMVLKNEPSVFSSLVDLDISSGGNLSSTPYGCFLQLVWLFVIVGMLLSCCSKMDNRLVVAMMCSMIMLMIFELLFEARARYIYCYVPVLIALSCLALDDVRGRRICN